MTKKRIFHPENLIPGDRYYLQYEEEGMLTINNGVFLEFYSRLEDDPRPKYTQDKDADKDTPHPVPNGYKNVLYLKFRRYVKGDQDKTTIEYLHIPYKTIKELM